ncbi:chaplin [Streptomyces flavofungini]|uniref:chaplin n=1 Tax=Streptomyces flavofungini TaxID=68200 RepID=UPI0025B195B5|nr:chaplin [Streptomyces flavofungini]WJV47505.1 chaplin [Streptomyces flavofungini]
MRQALTKGVLSAAAATSILSLPGQSAFAAADAHGQAAGSPGFLSGNNVQAPLEVPLNVCGNSVNGVGVGNPAMGNSCAHTSSPTAERAPERAAPPQREAAPKPAPAPVPKPAPNPAPAPERAAPAPASVSAPAPAHAPAQKPATEPETPAPADDGGTGAHGEASHSPGVLAGNLLSAPFDVPINACGNAVEVVAALSGTTGNKCGQAPEEAPPEPEPHVPPVKPERPVEQVTPPEPPRAPRTVPRAPEFLQASTAARPPRPAVRAEAPEHVDQLAATGMDQNALAAAAAGAGLLVGGALLYRRGRSTS